MDYDKLLENAETAHENCVRAKSNWGQWYWQIVIKNLWRKQQNETKRSSKQY